MTQTLLEELLAAKVMVPAMNEVASPVSAAIFTTYYIIIIIIIINK